MNAAEWTKQEYARLSRTIDFEHLPPRRVIPVKFRIVSITKINPSGSEENVVQKEISNKQVDAQVLVQRKAFNVDKAVIE